MTLTLYRLTMKQIDDVWDLLNQEIQFRRVTYTRDMDSVTLGYLTRDEYNSIRALFPENLD